MSIIILENQDFGDVKWTIQCARQQLTDILIQVWKGEIGDQPGAYLTFSLGELMREEIEGHGTMGGLLHLDDDDLANLTRWAEQLELYAQIMRSALKCQRTPSEGA